MVRSTIGAKKILYHGSKIADIDTLEPRRHFLFPNKAVVFATTDMRFALAMIYGSDHDFEIGYLRKDKEEPKMYIRELQPGKLQLLSQPGWLYCVDGTGFAADSRLAHTERISSYNVRVLQTTRINNIYEQLREYDINIVDYNQAAAIRQKRDNFSG